MIRTGGVLVCIMSFYVMVYIPGRLSSVLVGELGVSLQQERMYELWSNRTDMPRQRMSRAI